MLTYVNIITKRGMFFEAVFLVIVLFKKYLVKLNLHISKHIYNFVR